MKVRCDLAHITSPPQLLIIGENHENSNSIAIKKELLQRAGRGDFYLGTEVGINGPALPSARDTYPALMNSGLTSKNIYGIESPTPTAVITTYKIQNDLLAYGTSVFLLSEVAQNAMVLPIFREALEEIRREGSYPTSIQQIDVVINWLKKSVHNSGTLNLNEAREIMKKVSRTPISQDFFSAIHRKIIDITHRKFSDRLMGLKLPYYLNQQDSKTIGFELGNNRHFIPSSLIGKLLLDVRNRDFAEQIGDIICDHAGRNNRLVVLMGDDHVKEVMRFLKGLSGGALQMRSFQSFDSSQNDNLYSAVAKSDSPTLSDKIVERVTDK